MVSLKKNIGIVTIAFSLLLMPKVIFASVEEQKTNNVDENTVVDTVYDHNGARNAAFDDDMLEFSESLMTMSRADTSKTKKRLQVE